MSDSFFCVVTSEDGSVCVCVCVLGAKNFEETSFLFQCIVSILYS